MSDSSPHLPTSFDPAVFLHSELELEEPTSLSHSDELEALQQCIADDTRQKNRNGVVIQHRAWKITETFRSEEDYSIDTPLKQQTLPLSRQLLSGFSSDCFPSSPPSLAMPLISSPVAYPSSSAPHAPSPKKRKRSDAARSPLRDIQANKSRRQIGGFLDDSDDEDDATALQEHPLKRRTFNNIKDLPEIVAEYTPPASQEYVNPETVPVEELDDYFKSPSPAQSSPSVSEEPPSAQPRQNFNAKTLSGTSFVISKKVSQAALSYEELIASRSKTVHDGAQRNYYGLDIHALLEEAKAQDEVKTRMEQEAEQRSIEEPRPGSCSNKSNRTLMWTEKYRAKKFTDLVGDERTHRSVLRWLKSWDHIVFPGSTKVKSKSAKKGVDEEERHRKVLLLTGPPGLGKTTLAHVCARQAGYEVQEINASDERSRDVVKGRIRDMVGTENVRGISTNTANGKVRKAGKPVCVVVDEVDGVVSGSGGSGEGGFIKALIDLISLDERNARAVGQQSTTGAQKKRKGDKFRLLRPLILVCNDVYHPSLRPLRQSTHAEIVHIRKPALNMVVSRMHGIFEREGIRADSDGVRRLCEATWGVSTKKEGGTGSGTGEGDIRSIMVVGEWVAGRLNAAKPPGSDSMRLTRRWVEDNIINDLNHGGGAARSLGRGGAKDVVERVFREGAGFPKQAETGVARQGKQGVIGVAEAAKRRAMDRLREMANTSGDCDRIVSDCFTAYPDKPFQDDTLLSKPCAAYDWLHFHDTISAAVHGSQEWELAPYLPQSVLAFHDLFASPRQQSSTQGLEPDAQASVFSGPGAAYMAAEELKANRAHLMGLQSMLTLQLTRQFRSPQELALELLPYVLRMLSPDVKPVIVNTGPSGTKSAATASVRKASEKALVQRAVEAMAATGVRFERSRVEIDDAAIKSGGWVFRMEPPLDQLATFETLSVKNEERVRYAVRSVLESEWKRESARMDIEARRRRGGQSDGDRAADETDAVETKPQQTREKIKKDFFGRAIQARQAVPGEKEDKRKDQVQSNDVDRIWVSFHEGFSNAVRKPITIDELMRGL